HAVIEKKGRFENIELQGHAGLVLGKEIDLRLFLERWHVAFAVNDDGEIGLRRSLQIFDAAGTAVLKVFLTDASGAEEFDRLMLHFASSDQSARQSLIVPAAPAVERPDAEIDSGALRTAWAQMKDTHDFVFLLRRFGVSRTQALRLAGDQWADALPT